MGILNSIINKAKDALRPKLPVISVTEREYQEFLEKWAWINNERGNVLSPQEMICKWQIRKLWEKTNPCHEYGRKVMADIVSDYVTVKVTHWNVYKVIKGMDDTQLRYQLEQMMDRIPNVPYTLDALYEWFESYFCIPNIPFRLAQYLLNQAIVTKFKTIALSRNVRMFHEMKMSELDVKNPDFLKGLMEDVSYLPDPEQYWQEKNQTVNPDPASTL